MPGINKDSRDPGLVRRELDEAKDHVRCVKRICAMQARANGYFVFEHPASATSWNMAEVCRFGMAAIDPGDGELKPVQKRTAILTSYYEIAHRMRRDCPNRSGDECTHHTHLKLEGGTICKQAQVYPRDFCWTICEGMAAQRRTDSMNLVSMEVMSVEELMIMGHDELHEDHATTRPTPTTKPTTTCRTTL